MSDRELMLRLAGSVRLSDTEKLAVASLALAAVHSSGAISAASRKSELDDVLIAGPAWDLIVLALAATASADTRPQGGDAKLAPFTSGAVPNASEADAQTGGGQ